MLDGADTLDIMIRLGVLSTLYTAWSNTAEGVASRAFSSYCCLTGGTSAHIQAVFDTPRVMSTMFAKLQTSKVDDDVAKLDALLAVRNICTCGSDAQVNYLLDRNIAALLCPLLQLDDADIVRGAVTALHRLLQRTLYFDASRHAAVVNTVRDSGSVSALQQLCYDDCSYTVSAASSVLVIALSLSVI